MIINDDLNMFHSNAIRNKKKKSIKKNRFALKLPVGTG